MTPRPHTPSSPPAISRRTPGETPKTASGASWMHVGLSPDMKGDFQAAAFTLDLTR